MKHGNPKHVEIHVKLLHDLSSEKAYNMLVVDDGKHHHSFEKVAMDGEPHTITWVLTGNASGGEFCALDNSDYPGFTWLIHTPDKKVFRHLRHEGNKISMHNHHHGKDSEGMWHYQLFARFGDKLYGVPLTFSCGHSDNPNPSIKNT